MSVSMADRARPGDARDDEATAILRRLEPAIADVQRRLNRIEERQARINGGSEGLPNTWTIVSIMLALVAAILAGMGVIATIFA